MKKTLISLVLALALLSTCVFSIVFAAYTTRGQGSVTATVSTFGVTVTVTAPSEAPKLVPKGQGTLLTLKTEGTPSVAATTTYTASLTKKDGSTWKAGEADYFPIDITVGDMTYGICGTANDGTDGNPKYTKCNDFADLEAKVEAAIAALGGTYAAATHTISWSWHNVSENDNKLTATDAFELSVVGEVTQNP